MNNNNIKPERITKPIQLLAAWLIGLVLLESSLLTAAGTINNPDWLPALFGISAIVIIPLFLLMIFLLQTRFRPEMQEDSYYSKYLDRNTMTFELAESKNDKEESNKYVDEIIQITKDTKNDLESIKKILKSEKQTEHTKEINEIVEESDKKIDELKKIAKFSSIDLRVNKALNEYNNIVNIIPKIGFTRYTVFGEAPLDEFLISFGSNIPMSIVKDLTFELIPFGAQYVKKNRKIGNEKSSDNTIYIGSYAITDDKILINEDLINKLKSATDDMKFNDLK